MSTSENPQEDSKDPKAPTNADGHPEQPKPEKKLPKVSVISRPITRKGPPKPDSSDEEEMDRRSFLKWLTIGWAAFAAVVAGYGTVFMRYLFPNVLFEPKQSFRAGFPNSYNIGEVSERFKDQHGVWLVRDNEKIYALSTVCTHLGCTPTWLANESKYKCPCHGSGFYKNGINFEGPAPRPLERFKIYMADDGELVVDKTKKFQQEKGEWDDPESFVMV